MSLRWQTMRPLDGRRVSSRSLRHLTQYQLTEAQALTPDPPAADSPLISADDSPLHDHTAAHTFQTQITLCGVSKASETITLFCGGGVVPSARRPTLTALKLWLCKSEASGRAQSQTRLLWHVKQLPVCLGPSCHFPIGTTNIILSARTFWTPETILGRTQNNETAGCRAVTHHFSLSSSQEFLRVCSGSAASFILVSVK